MSKHLRPHGTDTLIIKESTVVEKSAEETCEHTGVDLSVHSLSDGSAELTGSNVDVFHGGSRAVHPNGDHFIVSDDHEIDPSKLSMFEDCACSFEPVSHKSKHTGNEHNIA